MAIEFTKDLETGSTYIDNQHRLIIQKINDLLTATKHGAGKVEAVEMIEFMQDYCNEHFAWEERYMKEFDYPLQISHFSEHSKCRVFFKNMKDTADTEGIPSATLLKLNRELVDWFITHIKGPDKKLASFLKEKMPQNAES